MNREQSLVKLRRLSADQRLVEARNLCLDLTRTYPKDIEIWKARLDLHYCLGEFDSLGTCVQAIMRWLHTQSPNPLIIDTYLNLGNMCLVACYINDAINIYSRLIAVVPNEPRAHTCLGVCLLLVGDFKRGWSEYEWRLKITQMKGWGQYQSHRPIWKGEPLHGKTILVISEQGIGDTIHFIRYAGYLKALGGKVILACNPKLHNFLANCLPSNSVNQFVNYGDIVPHYDVEVPLMSLPGIFRTSINTIPGDTPYLAVPQGTSKDVVEKITQHKNMLCVGITWRGGREDEHGRLRTIALEQLNDVLNIEGVKFFSLPRFPGDLDVTSAHHETLVDLESYLDLEGLTDTAAAIQELDLIISVDTTVVHLAGALGRPVWTLLPFSPDWRWMLNREDSPWYPTMRLFRQPTPGDWASVITRVKAELTALVHESNRDRYIPAKM